MTLALVAVPRGSFFGSDAGTNYLMARALVTSRWTSWHIELPSDHRQLMGRFFPLRDATDSSHVYGPNGPHRNGLVLERGGQRLGLYPPALPLAASPFLAWLGDDGLRVVPFVAGLATLALATAIFAPALGRAAPLYPLALGLGTPLIFYSVVYWGHTPGMALCLAGLGLLARPGGAARILAGGVLVGLSACFRMENALLAPAAFVGLVARDGRRAGRLLLPLVGGTLLGLAPQTAYNKWLFDTTRSPHHSPSVWWASHWFAGLEDIYLGGISLRLPVRVALVLPAALLALLALAAAVRRRHPSPRALAAVLATLGLAALVDVGLGLAIRPYILAGLFLVSPFLALALLPTAGPREGTSTPFWSWTALAFALALPARGMAGGFMWGPRYLLSIVPVLVHLALDRALAHDGPGAYARRLTLAATLAASVALQGVGLRDLAHCQGFFARVMDIIERSGAEAVAFEEWHLGWYVAPSLARREYHYLDSLEAARELAGRLAADGVGSVALVCRRAGAQEELGGAFTTAGWRIRDRIADADPFIDPLVVVVVERPPAH